MITAEQRKEEFITELTELLKKHGAELSVLGDPGVRMVGDDDGEYGWHHGEVTISMYGIWKDSELKADFCEFTLPTYIP